MGFLVALRTSLERLALQQVDRTPGKRAMYLSSAE
jgi:hypothetical protein